MLQTEQHVTMLIVEDQDLMRRMLYEFLQSAYPGVIIMEAADGASALKQCHARPRIVLMDVALPDANGIDLTAQIKQMLPESEIIIVSQHDSSYHREQAGVAGAFAYIAKDKVYRELLPTIDRALGRDRLR